MGYIRINPMALTGTMCARKINIERSISEAVFDIVLSTLSTAFRHSCMFAVANPGYCVVPFFDL